jgi:hypothetical protein
MSDEYTKGRWKEQETEVLKRLIREQLGAEPGTSMRALGKLVEEQGVQVPWSTISKRMVKRSRLSCFKKWQKLTGLFSLSDDHRSKAELLEAIAEDIKGNSEEGRDAKRAKIENDPTASFPQAPTAGAAAALAVAAGSTGGNSFYELYDSAKMADETVEGKAVVNSSARQHVVSTSTWPLSPLLTLWIYFSLFCVQLWVSPNCHRLDPTNFRYTPAETLPAMAYRDGRYVLAAHGHTLSSRKIVQKHNE